MKSNNADSHVAESTLPAHPAITVDDPRHYQETSHVFNCMQCNLQFQMNIAVLSREASTEIDEGIVRVRLDPRIKLEREEDPL